MEYCYWLLLFYWCGSCDSGYDSSCSCFPFRKSGFPQRVKLQNVWCGFLFLKSKHRVNTFSIRYSSFLHFDCVLDAEFGQYFCPILHNLLGYVSVVLRWLFFRLVDRFDAERRKRDEFSDAYSDSSFNCACRILQKYIKYVFLVWLDSIHFSLQIWFYLANSKRSHEP